MWAGVNGELPVNPKGLKKIMFVATVLVIRKDNTPKETVLIYTSKIHTSDYSKLFISIVLGIGSILGNWKNVQRDTCTHSDPHLCDSTSNIR